jgi:hypothetical protein
MLCCRVQMCCRYPLSCQSRTKIYNINEAADMISSDETECRQSRHQCIDPCHIIKGKEKPRHREIGRPRQRPRQRLTQDQHTDTPTRFITLHDTGKRGRCISEYGGGGGRGRGTRITPPSSVSKSGKSEMNAPNFLPPFLIICRCCGPSDPL